MSVVEKYNLQYDPRDPYRRGTILIVSSGEFTEALKFSLKEDNEQTYGSLLQYVYCEDIEFDMLSCPDVNQFSPDYIVIVLDPRNSYCTLTAEEEIKKIDKKYLSAGRICLVNGGCSLKLSQIKIGYGHINALSQKYSTILINGDVLKSEKCQILASRISRLACAVCGFSSGIPVNIDVPGYDQAYTS